MSNDIRRYEPDRDWFDDAEPLKVTSVMGSPRLDLRKDNPEERQGHGHSVQLTIGREFTILTEAQALDLMGVLSKRLACADGFSATALLEERHVQPDGTKEVVDEW